MLKADLELGRKYEELRIGKTSDSCHSSCDIDLNFSGLIEFSE